jgi:DNA-binding NarL/FixJ family response regulator
MAMNRHAGPVAPGDLRIAVLASRRVVGESVAAAIREGRGSVAVGSTDPRRARALPRRAEVVVVVGSQTDGSTGAGVTMARRRWRDSVIVALADTDRIDDGMALVAKGADTWLSRSDGLRVLDRLLDRIAAGERQLLPEPALALMTESVRQRTPNQRRTARLTARESQVLICFARGLSRPDIAALLAMAPGTLRTHVQNVLHKLELHSMSEAVDLANREGLVPALDTPTSSNRAP